MLPSGALETDRLPTVMLTVGSPKRAASAGVGRNSLRPLSSEMLEPSGKKVTFAGPDTFSVIVFQVSRLVNELVTEPVAR